MKKNITGNRLWLFWGLLAVSLVAPLGSQDWPLYKGNLFLTGNNDEIVVKNPRIKWIQKADSALYNPIVSDNRLYLIDKGGFVYCLDEESGEVIWKQNLAVVSRDFVGIERKPGKAKYPVIKDRYLIISDATMIYAFDKKNGEVLWSRTALENEKNPEKIMHSVIDGIYSDPTIHENEILYGTRKVFIARDLTNGHLLWNREDIKSFAGFPVFFENYILTQSMNYSSHQYLLYNLDLKSGRQNWVSQLDEPLQIISPVVYEKKVYIPVGSKICTLDLETGRLLWKKDYGQLVTSSISFADRTLVFALNNKDVVSADPDSGELKSAIVLPEQSSPLFVITRDQIYIASNLPGAGAQYESKGNETGAIVRAYARDSSQPQWEFAVPFAGGVSQPVSSRGVLFVPAGNYLYALGEARQSELLKDGADYFLQKTDEKGTIEKNRLFASTLGNSSPASSAGSQPKAAADIALRPFDLSVVNEQGQPVVSEAEIILRKAGKIVYDQKLQIDQNHQKIQIPVPTDDSDEVEINTGSPEHAPQKVIVKKDESEKSIVTAKIVRGESFSLDSIVFESGRAHLKAESLQLLGRTAELLRKNSDLKVEIRGHTDSLGDEAYNQTLSEKRAEAVRDYLIKQGISPLRLGTRGLGESKPVADNATEEGRAKNRRTEFFILK